MTTISDTAEINNALLDSRAQDYALDMPEIEENLAQLTLSLGEDESEAETAENTLIDLFELADGLESIRNTLAVGDGDRLTMRFAHVAVESLNQAKYVEMDLPDPSQLGSKISKREFSALTMESITDGLRKAAKAIIETIQRLVESFWKFLMGIVNYFKPFRMKIASMRKKAEALRKARAEPAQKKITLPASLQYSFQVNGKAVSPATLLSGDGTFVSVMGNFTESYLKYTSAIVKQAEHFTQTGELNGLYYILDTRQTVYRSFKGASTTFEQNDTTIKAMMGNIPGNRFLRFEAPMVNRSNIPLEEYLRDNGKFHLQISQDKSVEPTIEMPVLTLNQIIGICKDADRALDVMSDYKDRAGEIIKMKDKLLRRVGVLDFGSMGTLELGSESLLREVLKMVARYIRNLLSVGREWLSTSIQIVRDCTQSAHLSLEQYKEV